MITENKVGCQLTNLHEQMELFCITFFDMFVFYSFVLGLPVFVIKVVHISDSGLLTVIL